MNKKKKTLEGYKDCSFFIIFFSSFNLVRKIQKESNASIMK